MEVANKILVPHGAKEEAQRVLGYSQPTIRRALNGAADTKIARRIRCWALAHGGAEVEPVRYERVDNRTWKRVRTKS